LLFAMCYFSEGVEPINPAGPGDEDVHDLMFR